MAHKTRARRRVAAAKDSVSARVTWVKENHRDKARVVIMPLAIAGAVAIVRRLI